MKLNVGRLNIITWCSDASTARDTRYLASFSTSPQFGIFGTFGRRRDPACLQNGGAPIVSRKSFNFIIMKVIFGWFFQSKMLFHMNIL